MAHHILQYLHSRFYLFEKAREMSVTLSYLCITFVIYLIICDSEAVLCLCVSVSRLHERWLKDCVFYRDLYKQMNEIGLQPRINWIQVFNQKQVSSKGANHPFFTFTMSLTLSLIRLTITSQLDQVITKLKTKDMSTIISVIVMEHP